MRTSSGTFAFVVFAGIAILAVLNCSQRRLLRNDTFVLTIGKKGVLGFGKEFVPVKKDDLDSALHALSKQAQYDLYFLSRDGGDEIPHYTPPPNISLKTNRVITADVAQQTLAEQSAVNDPHVTYKVQSSDPTDIKTVLDAFQ